ncbi:ABC transporter ATP-binding protein [Pseudoflavonifractor sp. MSJ-37]|uniref:ABC transporter ATP-binding protein n=1 Tax=Pseudoflavonifractor sp. MSJ-37 TaxID=2841531 RepID=UPI001C1023BA|nr:ABC transporter ATP-binding protein [Pseudoflavonifractor sp. MSJ-37]MBU5434626.1 ABC transporter ATP-binding protein [Pseudoflavonifractor sp. MSJ-37]
MLSIEHLRYWYQPGRPVLEDVSFALEGGDILCLLGPNGTGKTTLLRCLLGLSQAKGGEVVLDGQSLSHLSHRGRAKRLAYVPQSTAMAFPYEVREVVLMGRVPHLPPGASYRQADHDTVAEALDRLQIGHLARRKFQELSGGERQMVLVARALAQQANYLVMDEPTANLDYGNQVKILRVVDELAQSGYGILMTSHYPDHAFLVCTKAVLMRDGRVMAWGAPGDVVTTEALTALYQTPVCVSTASVDGMPPVPVCVPLLRQSR